MATTKGINKIPASAITVFNPLKAPVNPSTPAFPFFVLPSNLDVIIASC